MVVFSNNREVNLGESKFCPLSDHYGVAARIRLSAPSSPGAAPSHPQLIPQLLADPTAYRKSIEYSSGFLLRSSLRLRRGARNLYFFSMLMIFLPFLFLIAFECSAGGWRGFLRSPVVSVLCGAVGIVCFLLARLNRTNESVMMQSQGEDLSKLLL